MKRPYRHIDVERQKDVFCVRMRKRKLDETELHEFIDEVLSLIHDEGCRKMALSLGPGSPECLYSIFLAKLFTVRKRLIEAGGKGKHPNIAIPAAFAKQFKTKLDWDYATEPEPHCAGRSLYIPRGKGLGGSSNMNAMLYVRGRPLDYDMWERDYGGSHLTVFTHEEE